MIRTQKQNINEDISPSWFNSQNQRIDVSEIEEIEWFLCLFSLGILKLFIL